MIQLRNVTKTYPVGKKRRIILDDVNVEFIPGVNVGILGRNGAGKSTLIKIIGGSAMPDSGEVQRTSRISWPIGFAGCFHGSLTGRDNLRFICRIYGEDFERVSEFVEEFTELGNYMEMPVKTYSSGMSAKLAFGLSMAIGFDFYLIDEVTAVGDASFRAKSQKIFNERKSSATLLVVSHSMDIIKQHCDVVGVLDQGSLLFFDNLTAAHAYYMKCCATTPNYKYV